MANRAALPAAAPRDEALRRSLVSAHVVIRVAHGELISLLDPPAPCRDAVASRVNEGVWPIILYDYPQIAPESPGDLFDGTEIDEILGLRILTMTEDEKREARESDARARAILDRTEGLGPDHWARLHGALRGLRRMDGGSS